MMSGEVGGPATSVKVPVMLVASCNVLPAGHVMVTLLPALAIVRAVVPALRPSNGRNLRSRQCLVVNGNSSIPPAYIRPAVACGTDCPIAVGYGERAGGGCGAGDPHTIAVELPVCAIVSTNQVDPVGTSKITARDGEARAIEITASVDIVCISNGSRTNHIVSSAASIRRKTSELFVTELSGTVGAPRKSLSSVARGK